METPVFEGTLRSIDVGGPRPLRFITSGGIPEHPIRMLKESVLSELLAVAAEEYDRVIIDSPPSMLFPDAAVLSACADGVVIVARAGVTPFDALVETADQIRHAEKPLVGSVLNGIDFERDRDYDRSYRWYELDESYGKAPAVTVG
jgi:Mrp family chromosome partitioning ATPase